MIYQCYFAGMPSEVNVASFGKPAKFVSPWAIIRQQLETSHDTFVWIITRKQLRDFLTTMRYHDLEKFCVVKHDEVVPVDSYNKPKEQETMGCSNYNYPNDPRKLKIFVMKGAKAK